MGDQVPWPQPPRQPGPWNGGPPVSPPGNTPLPPLPGAGTVMHGTTAPSNPWSGAQTIPQVNIPPDRPGTVPPPPPVRPALVDRAPSWLLGVAAVVVVAMIAGGAYVVLKGGRQYPSRWDPRVEDITTWVAKERELDYKHPVKVNFLTPKAYTARATAGGDDASAESKQYYADQEAQLRALGFLSGKTDLAKAQDTLSDSGTLAYYDPTVEEVFVRGTDLTPDVRVTLAHELTHVLQDQHFDLQRIDSYDDGRASVLRALAEGDATKVEDAYVEKVLTPAERKAYEKQSQDSGDSAKKEIDKSVPPILTTLFASPYILGPQLIDVLDEQGGWKAIDDALQNPPSEEALFDPTVYGTDALDPVSVDVTAPEGTQKIEDGEFGPTAWYLMLASRMDPHLALAAVDGWGGDRYVVYRQDKKVCIEINARGDNKADTEQLSAASGAWAAKSPKGSAESRLADGEVQLRSCDPGADAKVDGKAASMDLLTLPVTRSQVYLQALQAKQTPKASSCFADGIVDAFTTDQLSDPKGTYINSAEGQRKVLDLRNRCFN